MVFGAVVAVYAAGFGILTLTKKHRIATGQYNTRKARYNREERIIDIE